MAILLVALLVMCIAHYLYQNIYLTTMRQSSRYELCNLRDELRARLIDVQDSSNINTITAFKEVDDGISRSLNCLEELTFTNLVRVYIAAKQNEQKVETYRSDFINVLESSEDEKPKEIYNKVSKVLFKVLRANSLMFTIYLLPFFIPLMILSKGKQMMSEYMMLRMTDSYLTQCEDELMHS